MNTNLIQPHSTVSYRASEGDDLSRLDKFLLQQLPAYSRSYLQRLIENGFVRVNEAVCHKSSLPLKQDDAISITFPASRSIDPEAISAQTSGVELVFEHPHFLVLSKPAGLNVHQAYARSEDVSLVDFLLKQYTDIASIGYADRPGIVHRLDKDTSGLIIIARTNYAHSLFGKMFHDRLVHKTYYAVVQGHPAPTGTIDLAIGRDPHVPVKMRAFREDEIPLQSSKIRDALTHYRVLEYFKDSALVEVKPVTGRTHQIRVHFAAIGHPIIGDTVYGSASKLIGRQALHAQGISFEFDGEPFSITKEIPEDMQLLIQKLRA